MRVLTLALAGILSMVPMRLCAQSMPVYVGPQLGLLGIGASAEVDLGAVSVSGEFGWVPISSIAFEEEDIDFLIDTKFYGGLLMANVGPRSSRFALSGGLLIGGYNADGQAEDLRGDIEIGNGSYDSADIGDLLAELDFGGIAPAVMIGLRGRGFNIGVGVAITGSAEFTLDASGPIASDPQFQADLALEQEEIQDELDVVPVLPLFRLGWQFGVAN